MPASAVRPRKQTVHSTALAVDVRRVYGFQAYCACGWEGATRKGYGEAQADRREHTCGEAAV